MAGGWGDKELRWRMGHMNLKNCNMQLSGRKMTDKTISPFPFYGHTEPFKWGSNESMLPLLNTVGK